jgi:hypothetical protein
MKILFLYPYQIVLLIISLLFLFDRLQKFIKKEPRQSLLKLLASIIIWSSILILTIVPSLASEITKLAGAHDQFEALILIGFTVVFMVIYKLLAVIEKLDKNITELVRKEALRDVDTVKIKKQFKQHTSSFKK